MTLRRGFLAESERIAIRVRASMELRDFDPISPAAVCEHYDIELMKLSDLPNILELRFASVRGDHGVYSGHTFQKGIRRVICYNDYQSRYRQNSTICHELAHCFLNHSNTQLRTETGDRAHVRREEEEAAALSGYLLMTNAACWHVVKNSMQSTAQTVYGVSSDMLNFRIKKSGAMVRFVNAQRKRLTAVDF